MEERESGKEREREKKKIRKRRKYFGKVEGKWSRRRVKGKGRRER